jgi:hypothetical protein
MGIKLSNNAFGTLAAGINSSATSITLTSGQGARFPTLGAGDYFYATLIDTSNNLEIVKCTARSTDVLTVVRAQESTTARAYSTGDRIEIRLTAQTFVDATDVLPLITAANVSNELNTATGYFQVPQGTTAQRPASPAVGMVRFNTDLNYLEEYRTGQWLAVSNVFTASGGTETTVSGYKYHIFTSSGTFIVQAGVTSGEYLIVGGGGGGGTFVGGGAGAGGVVTGSTAFSVGTYTVTVGAGAAAQSTNGNNSSLGSLVTAIGGGAGGADGQNPGNGGSGGGGRFVFGTGTSGQGNNGASGLAAPYYQTGGGGGANAAGGAGNSGGGGNGGAGRQLTNFAVAGSPAGYYGGGGGGGWAGASFAGTGLGGIGGGGAASQSGNGGAGTANTGGGGGGNASAGGSFTGLGGNGGSGIVIIRYAI